MEECVSSFTNNSNLSRIFLKDNKHNYIPIIDASSQSIILFLDEISNYKNELSYHGNTTQNNVEDIINTLMQLTRLVQDEPHLATILLNYTSSTTNHNLFIILCELYLNATTFPQLTETITTLLQVLLTNVTCSINVYNYIYRQIKRVFIDSNNDISITTMERYLSLLNILYGNFELKDITPMNYMYFNGEGNITLDLKSSPLCTTPNIYYNLNKLSYGFYVHMWLYIEFDYALLPEEMLLDKDKGIVCRLLRVEYTNSFFEVVITNANEVKIHAQELETKELGGKYLPYKKWIQFKFEFTHKSSPTSTPYLTYYISEEGNKPTETDTSTLNDSQFKLNYHSSMDKEITNITLCDNFIGRITNILIYNYLPQSKPISTTTTQGKINNKNGEHFYKYTPEIGYNEIIQTFKTDNKTTLYYFLSSKQATVSNESKYKYILNNQITYSECMLNSNNQNKYNGIVNIEHLFKNIKLIGGFNNFLPLGEILYKHQDILLPNADSPDNLLLVYLNMINSVMNKNYFNIENAIQVNFFTFIKVILSHFPEKFYTQHLVNSLVALMTSISNFQLSCTDYINLIICPKILSKFNINQQIDIWNQLILKENDMFVSNTLTMDKICLWIKNYDQNGSNEYCCKEHYDYFIHDDIKEPQIMKVPLKKQIEPLLMFVDVLFISDYISIKDIRMFFGMLTCEISPCLQIEILSRVSSLFEVMESSNFNKERFRDFINKIFLDILIYVFAVGLYDVKAKVIEIVKKLMVMGLIEDENHAIKQMLYMFKENVIMDYFEIKKENIKELTHSSLTSSKLSGGYNNSIQFNFHLDKSELSKKRSYSRGLQRRKNVHSLSPCKLNKQFSKSPEHSYGKIEWKFNSNNSFNDSSRNDVGGSDIQNNNEAMINEIIKKEISLQKEHKSKKLQIKRKSKKLPVKYPNESNQLVKYMNKQITDNALLELLVSLLNSKNLPITKYKLIIKSLSSIPNKSHLQIDVIASWLSDIKKFNENKFQLLTHKSYFLNWFIETTIFMQLIYKCMIPEESSPYKCKLECIIKAINELFWKKMMYFIIQDEKQFINFINTILNYIIYFSYITPGIQQQFFLNNYLGELIGYVRKELDEAISPNNINDTYSLNNSASKQKKDNYKLQQHPFTLHQHLLDVISYEYIMNFPQNENDTNHQISLNYVSELPARKIFQAKTKDDWRDFPFFKSLWERFKTYWDFESLFIQGQNISEKVIEFTEPYYNSLVKIAPKSKERDRLDEMLNKKDILKLTKTYSSNNYITKLSSMPFIQILSNLFMILLRLQFVDLSEQITWLNNYQFFIVYCILLSCKVNDNSSMILEPLIKNNYAFILKHFINNSPDDFVYKSFTTILINITQLFANLMIKANKKSFISIKSNYSKKIIENVFRNIIDWNSIKDPQNPDITTLSIDKLQSIAEDRKKCLKLYDNYQEQIHQLTIELFVTMISQFQEDELEAIKLKRNATFIKQIKPFYSYVDIISWKSEQPIKIHPHYISVSHYLKQKEVFEKAEAMKSEMTNFLKKPYNCICVSKKEKSEYKSMKKSLFSWNNAWSEWEVFYNETSYKKLKFKISNYYTSNYMRPFLVPILDINYYLPVFSQFDVKTLFHYSSSQTIDKPVDTDDDEDDIITNDDIYNVELDYNKIFSLNKNLNKTCMLNSTFNIQNMNTQKQPTFIKYLYSNTYEFNEHSSSHNNNDNKISNLLRLDPPSSILANIKLCCIVKQSNHIHCLLEFKKNDLTFIRVSETNKLYLKFVSYEMWDCDRNTCFGSFFAKYPKDIYFKNIKIPFSSIHMILKRNYFYKNCALEIFTNDHKSIYIHFKNENRCRNALVLLLTLMSNESEIKEIKIPNKSKDKDEHIVGYICIVGDKSKYFYYNLNTLNDNWKNCKISNFDYLMYLNLFANRSYIDLNQYPVMPWIIKDYNCFKLALNTKEKAEQCLRDLHCPMGMLALEENGIKRKLSYIENYKTLLGELKQQLGYFEDKEELLDSNETQTPKENETEEKINEKVWNEIEKGKVEIDLIPYYYGSHYSNPMYVTHYLMRLFPYSSIIIELQGNKFDDPQRLFLSINNTFNSATTHKTDVRELIPEFFYLPEMFLNINKLNMGSVNEIDEESNQKVSYIINNVLLPKWANNDAYKFVSIMRELLDSDKINICPWIELIFGLSQSGKKARRSKNLFLPYSYTSYVDMNKVELSKQATYRHMFEIGITPHQLFYKDIQNKIIPKYIKEQCTSWNETNIVIHTPRLLKNNFFPAYYSLIDTRKILIIFLDMTCGRIEMNYYPFAKALNEERNVEDKTITDNPINSIPKITRLHVYMENNIQSYHNHTYVIYNKGKNIVIGGFWDGSIVLYLRALKPSKLVYPLARRKEKPPITFIYITSDETKAFCGLMNGILYKFEIASSDANDNKDKWNLIYQTHAHSKEITCINHSTTLQVVATTSYDGYVNIYKETDLKLMRSVYIHDYEIDKVILVASPLPSFVVYSMNKKLWKIFGINSIQSIKDVDTNETLTCYKIIKDHTFSYFIVYGNDKGEVVIAKLPFLEVIKREIVFDDNEKVRWIEVSEDLKTIYMIGDNGKLAVLCDKELTRVSGGSHG